LEKERLFGAPVDRQIARESVSGRIIGQHQAVGHPSLKLFQHGGPAAGIQSASES
jgi:hypothetical protein